MAERLGGGEWSFEVNESWAKIPDEIVLGDCAAVGVDSKDNVYAFNRGDHPVAVFDQDGNLLRTWGEGVFTRPHGVHMAPDDTIWLTDDGDHTVRHCTLDGRVLLTLGIPGKPSPFMSGEPFHRCTHTALSPQCDHLYISDGYGNARIHKFTVDGKLLSSWGEPGTDPGQFNIPHNICCDPDGWLYVADRENHRVQVFDGNGKWRDAVELPAPAERHVPGARRGLRSVGAALLYRRRRAVGRDQPRLAEYRAAGQHPHAERREAGPARQAACRHPAGAVHLAARHRRRFAAATSMSANCRAAPGRASRKTRRPRSAASSTASRKSLRNSCPQRLRTMLPCASRRAVQPGGTRQVASYSSTMHGPGVRRLQSAAVDDARLEPARVLAGPK